MYHTLHGLELKFKKGLYLEVNMYTYLFWCKRNGTPKEQARLIAGGLLPRYNQKSRLPIKVRLQTLSVTSARSSFPGILSYV